MAGDTNFNLIFKLCVIIFKASLNNNRVRNGIMAVAPILVEPRWDMNASQCFVDTNTTGGIHFHGSAMETCSLQVLVSRETHIQLQISGRSNSQETAFVHMERNGDLEECSHKYVVFEQIETCNSIVIHTNINVILLGSVSLFVSEIPALDTSTNCPEDEIQDRVRANKKSNCSNVKGYNEQISCNPRDNSECVIKFPPNCGAVLGQREVIYQKCFNDRFESHTALIIYPIQKTVLDLSDNNIFHIGAYTFQSLGNIHELNLNKNSLSTLNNADEFLGLINLTSLDLDSNQITQLGVELFLHLKELKHISIRFNMLKTLPTGTFQNLFNLERLCITENPIANIDPEVFAGLVKLKELCLNGNILVTIPPKSFQNLLNLET